MLILGHARGTPETMQREPYYDDTLAEVGDELAAAVSEATSAGIAADRIVVDPGIGFGKRGVSGPATVDHCSHGVSSFGRIGGRLARSRR